MTAADIRHREPDPATRTITSSSPPHTTIRMLSIRLRYTFGVLMAFGLVLQRGAAAFSRSSRTCRKSSRCLLNMAKDEVSAAGSKRPLRVLALHGSEGNGPEFAQKLKALEQSLQQDVDIVAPTAPFEKGQGYAWWTMTPGERSFNAQQYIGFETSEKLVLEALQQHTPDVVVAHSQGAILIAALLGLNRIERHPPLGYVLNGVAWPNPYSQQMQEFKVKQDDSPRVLFLMGQADRINPPASAEQVQASLEQAHFDVDTWKHPGGHSVPTQDEEAMKALAQWMTKMPITT